MQRGLLRHLRRSIRAYQTLPKEHAEMATRAVRIARNDGPRRRIVFREGSTRSTRVQILLDQDYGMRRPYSGYSQRWGGAWNGLHTSTAALLY